MPRYQMLATQNLHPSLPSHSKMGPPRRLGHALRPLQLLPHLRARLPLSKRPILALVRRSRLCHHFHFGRLRFHALLFGI